MKTMCKLLEKDPSPRGFSLFKGASQFLQKLLAIYAEEGREENLTNRKVMQAYVTSIDACYEVDLTCYIETLSSIYNLLQNPKTLDRFSYDSWESGYSPFEVVYQISCFNDLKKYYSHEPLPILAENLLKVQKRHNRLPDGAKVIELENVTVSILKKIIDLVADLYESDSFKGSKESLIDFFLDVKAFNSKSFEKLTTINGFDSYLKFLANLDNHGFRGQIWVRHVMVPGLTDNKESMEDFINILKPISARVDRLEI